MAERNLAALRVTSRVGAMRSAVKASSLVRPSVAAKLSISNVRAVISAVLGSSIALWSANGICVNTSLLLSTSNDAQPPSFPCM